MVTEPAHFTGAVAGGSNGGSAVSASTAAASSGGNSKPLPRVGKRGAPQAFARKLYEILTTESEAVIAWNADGTAFHVKDVDSFSEETLTKYYRHSKFSSFQRQLNLYSFRKIVKGTDAGGYAHPMFRRDRPDDLYHVRRSISGSARYEPAHVSPSSSAKTAAAASRRNAGRASSKAHNSSNSSEWCAPRAHKSSGAARRVGKLTGSSARSRAQQQKQQQEAQGLADHDSNAAVAAAAAIGALDEASAGERSPWTSGESSDSDVSLTHGESGGQRARDGCGADPAAAAAGGMRRTLLRGDDDESSDSDLSDAETAESTAELLLEGGQEGTSIVNQQRGEAGESAREALLMAGERVEAQAGVEKQQDVVAAVGAGRGDGAAAVAAPSRRASPLNFFKKSFSFMDRSSSRHSRGLSTSSSVDMTAGESQQQQQQQQALAAGAGAGDAGDSISPEGDDVSHLMVDTSATARAAAAGLRPPPVIVTGRVAVDPTTAAGNKVLTSSPLTPKSSTEAASVAAAAAAAAAAAMPPPPKREQREELGLVEQLTNMVEVFDICDLLRKVSNSNSSRLDKHGGIVKSAGGGGAWGGGGGGQAQHAPHHLRNMSVDTDQGLPQSPQSRDGQAGLGSLASMELVRDSSKDWDTLMAGSADVSDLGSTVVQSVAEFFSF